jgi:biotin carboxyl carrier protein
MKMENSIEATQDGTVTAINVSKGDSVLEGAAIITIG